MAESYFLDSATGAKIKLRKASGKRRFQTNLVGWLFILPAFLGFLVFIALPIIIAIITSFSDYNGIDDFGVWGFFNYKEIFSSDIFHFRDSLSNLFWYVILYVPLNIIISMLLGVLVSGASRNNKFFRACFYIPSLTSGIAVSTVWAWMLNPSMGLINTALRAIGIASPPNWTNDPNMTMITLTIVSLWGGCAVNMVTYVAGIQGISESLYEAAKIEGANALQTTTKITLPMLKPITFFVMTTVLINSFQLYDQVLMLFGDGGNPSYSSLTPVMAIQWSITRGLYYGMGAAMSTLLLVVIMAVTFVTQRINKETY